MSAKRTTRPAFRSCGGLNAAQKPRDPFAGKHDQGGASWGGGTCGGFGGFVRASVSRESRRQSITVLIFAAAMEMRRLAWCKIDPIRVSRDGDGPLCFRECCFGPIRSGAIQAGRFFIGSLIRVPAAWRRPCSLGRRLFHPVQICVAVSSSVSACASLIKWRAAACCGWLGRLVCEGESWRPLFLAKGKVT